MNVLIISDNSIQPANSTIETAFTGCTYSSRIFLSPKTSIMKLRIFALLFITVPIASQAQLGGKLFNKVKNKVDQRVDRKVDAQIDKSLDEIEGKEQKETAKPAETSAAQPEPETKPADPGLKSFAKYDFIPGEVVIYSNDFATDNMGELPAGWNTSGNGVV